MNRLITKGVSFALAVACNFVLNRLWTYPDSRSKSVGAQMIQFFLVSVVGLGINLLIFGWVDALVRRPLGQFLALYAAQCTAVGVALVWNYAANRLITYGDVGLGR